ncbi:MAG: DUF378 domain-containing protein [Candidatus Paceibacterota bacterium]
MTAFVLLVIGGLNWGLYAFNYNLVNMLLGSWPTVEKIVYILVGLSAILAIFSCRCKACQSDAGSCCQ